MIATLMLMTMLSAAPVPDPPSSDEELKKIQGEWVVVKIAWQDKPHETTDRVVTINQDNASFRDPTGAVDYKIKRIKSGEIDLVRQTRPAVGVLHIGIYAVDGDTLKISFDVDGQSGDNPPKRPTDYESPKESSYVVYFLERRKNSDQ